MPPLALASCSPSRATASWSPPLPPCSSESAGPVARPREFLPQLLRHPAQDLSLTNGQPHVPVHERAAHRLEVAVLGIISQLISSPPSVPMAPIFRPTGQSNVDLRIIDNTGELSTRSPRPVTGGL